MAMSLWGESEAEVSIIEEENGGREGQLRNTRPI